MRILFILSLLFGFSQVGFAEIKRANVVVKAIAYDVNGRLGSPQELESRRIEFDTAQRVHSYPFEVHQIRDLSFQFHFYVVQSKMNVNVDNFLKAKFNSGGSIEKSRQYGLNELRYRDLTAFLNTEWSGSFNHVFDDGSGVYLKIEVQPFF